MIDDNGTVLITLFGKVLGFNKKMEKGIINPNKCRSVGVKCVDDHTDPTSKLGFI